MWGIGPGVSPPATQFAPLRGPLLRAHSTIPDCNRAEEVLKLFLASLATSVKTE